MSYKPPFFLFTPDLETIYPALLRRVDLKPFRRERIRTADDDFLDLDWVEQNAKRLVILSHGLEGSSSRGYMRGMAKAFFDAGTDVVAWNFRGCSEEMNTQLRFYHSGATDDLDLVVQHALQKEQYDSIYLIGFSLGGNLTLKYLGERTVSERIRKAVVFSVPMDLQSSCEKISQPANRVYAQRFLTSLKKKVLAKSASFPSLDTQGIATIKTLMAFDDRYTAPLHGFADARTYYEQCSAIGFVQNITIPTLIVNAQNDPFLSAKCFPTEKLQGHPFVSLESPRFGGHVGFAQFNKNGLYWSEARALEFITHD